MLKFHLLVPSKNKQTIGTFYHYLSLGAHQSPYVLEHIHSFSIITLNPKQKLPTIDNNQEGKFSTVVLPLKGKLKVDSQVYKQSLYEKQILICNPKDIGAVEDQQQSTSFAYIAVKGDQIKQTSIQLKRYQQNVTIEVEKAIILVVEGKITYKEGDVQVTLKSKGSFEELPNLFYSRRAVKVEIEENSLILIIGDKL